MDAMTVDTPGLIETAPLHHVSRDVPAPASGEILLRVQACAVCRTDLQIAEGDITAKQTPCVPGHQIVGVVEALSSDVDGWQRGDTAGVAWRP